MIVMKFGGSVLSSSRGLRRVAEILSEPDVQPALVVVSAIGSTTRELERVAMLARDAAAADARDAAESLFAAHTVVIDEAIRSTAVRGALMVQLQECRRELDLLIEGISITRQLTPRTLDTVMAIGESLSRHLVHHALIDAGLDACSIDARQVVVTDSTFGYATPLPDRTALRAEHDLRPLMDRHPIVVVQGFVGRSEDGVTTTMGKESSNLTAVLLASVLGIHDVTIFTDVPGVRSADPSLCPDTLPRPTMSYAEARLAAVHGVKILYPTMIEPAENAGVAITIAGIASDTVGTQAKMTAEVTRISASGGPCGPIVTAQLSADTCVLTCIFGEGMVWLQTVTDVLTQCAVTQFDLVWSAAERVGTVTLPSTAYRQALILLHQHMMIHETRP